ncbi:DUF3099 domain-containing protein [Actinacidiphila sp. DG2A-62]|uniref:DUF3099 domain-containing protein n=1 Tax=Actinacidiphila sp. DG2A-62 TaxID=3108821 RepID=UPI002DBE802B|nr:DUF3099 domain-containing protein [Actinacidiphila sp. DG2A-62]MEC3996010.1 DUF3099 domain-containing protein [Actinacidiphila sp. DG2A-62]
MYARRRHWYFAMMGTCVVLFVLAWAVVRIWSVPAAIAMCVVAMVIPPAAAIVANRRGPDDHWWDEETGDPESDRWWAELDGKTPTDGTRDPRDQHGHHRQPPPGP